MSDKCVALTFSDICPLRYCPLRYLKFGSRVELRSRGGQLNYEFNVFW